MGPSPCADPIYIVSFFKLQWSSNIRGFNPIKAGLKRPVCNFYHRILDFAGFPMFFDVPVQSRGPASATAVHRRLIFVLIEAYV